jgi:APA family basic amino acid/polyamine antiporter
VRESIVAVCSITVLEVAGLLAILVWGHPYLAELPARANELVPLDPAVWPGVFAGALIAFYAFIGFEDIVNLAEEVRDPRRVVPLAIVLTLAITFVLYMLVVGVAIVAVGPEALAASDAPLSMVFERSGGSAEILSLIALAALLNGALIQIVKAARILYGMAEAQIFPAILGRVHPRTQTPLLATALVTAITLTFAVVLPLETLAEVTSVIALLVFALANVALVAVKRRDPSDGEHFRVPMAVPVIGFSVSIGLLGIRAAQALLSG